MQVEALRLDGPAGPLSAELTRPEGARAVLVLAHGAGAGFRNATLVAIGEALAARGIATLRFNFPFMEAGRRRVDGRATSVAAVVQAIAAAAAHCPDLALFAGGHSFGGRMVSHALAEGHAGANPGMLPRGLVCLSFPLHPARKPRVERAAHLGAITLPMLFLSGTRDDLASPELLHGVVVGLGERARLHWLDDADHGYRARKRSRRDPRPVLDELADEAAAFMGSLA